MPHISVVTSLYKSEAYVDEFYRRCRAAIDALTDSYEFIFVDDGSPDDCEGKVRALIETDPNVRLVELSRNFGHHKALLAGLEHARGDYVFLLDSDLEEDPELLTRFYELIRNDPSRPDVVYGYMEHRKGKWLERMSGALFYRLINLMADTHIPPNALVARLMTQNYVRSLVRYRESHVFLGGVLQLAGYRQLGVPAEKTSKGTSTYTLNIKVAQAMDAVLSFTNKPLTYVAMLGLAISSITTLVAVLVVARILVFREELPATTVAIVSIWFLGGLIIFTIGVVGFYVGRIYNETKHRPNVVVREVFNPPRAAPPPPKPDVTKDEDHLEDLQLILDDIPPDMPRRGLIHVGAHEGQEVDAYFAAGFERIILIEANPALSAQLHEKYADDDRIKIFDTAIGDTTGNVTLHIHTSRRGSTEPASVLPMKEFKRIVTALHTPESVEVPMTTLDRLLDENQIDVNQYNFLNIDIQGAEMQALCGAVKTLAAMDAVICEVALLELYEGQTLEAGLVQHFATRGFRKRRTVYHSMYDEMGTFPAWGESLFVRER